MGKGWVDFRKNLSAKGGSTARKKLSAKQRSQYKKTKVTYHLRKPSEGTERGFTKPRTKHSFLGIPSVTISAAVAKDRVIMWHAHTKTWNGQTAAETYEGPLARALRRTWGSKRQYTLVEDGDRKGNQSGKGIKAKERAHIKSMTLPPRTPSWMPLDYSLWYEIDERMVKNAPRGTETKSAFLARLEHTARTLPRGMVRKVIGRMKRNIQAIVDARGWHPKND